MFVSQRDFQKEEKERKGNARIKRKKVIKSPKDNEILIKK